MSHSNLNKNNIFNSIATFTNLLFPIITFPYLTRVLGVDNIGKYNFSNSVVSYFSLIATLGISSYAIRECAKIKSDRNEFNKLASDIFSIDVYSTIIAYVLLLIAVFVSSKLKNYSLFIMLLSTSFITDTLGASWVLNAVDDFKYLSLRTILIHIVSLIGIFIFVKSDSHLYRYILILVFINVGSSLASIFYRKKYVDIRFKLIPDIKKHLKKIVLLFSQTVSMLIYTNADMIMLGYCYTDEIVGIYAIAVRVYNIVNGVIASVIGVATPGLSYDYANKDYIGFNDKITYVVNYIVLLFIPAFVGMNIMAPEIIKLISGRVFVQGEVALRILSFSLLFSLISAVLGLAILFPMGYDRVNFNSCIISAITNIVLNIYFVPKFGIAGAAFTTAIAELSGFINKIKHIDRKISIYDLGGIFRKYLIGGVIVALICFASKRLIENMNIRAIFAILFSALAYFSYLLLIKDKFFLNLITPIKNKLFVDRNSD